MDNTTALKRWLAVVRVATGAVFVYTLMLVIELGFLWTGAWHPYSLDSLLFARRPAGGWQRAVAGQRS